MVIDPVHEKRIQILMESRIGFPEGCHRHGLNQFWQ